MTGRKNIFKKSREMIRHTIAESFSSDALEIHSNKYALISGCKKLIEYTPDRIVLSFRSMRVTISGDCLEPESLINGQISIRGTIKEVCYDVD